MKKKKIISFAAGGISLALLVGSWAFYSSTNVVDNQLKTKAYGDTLHEKFTPDTDWEPGEEVMKEVKVINTGDYDLVTRVKLNEEWWRDANNNTSKDSGEEIIAIDSVTSGAGKINYDSDAVQYDFDDVGPLDGTNDGKVNESGKSDETVVKKVMENLGDEEDEWTLGADGWWYYNGVLSATDATSNLLSTIMLASDADMGKYDVTKYYTTNLALEGTIPNATNIDSGNDYVNKWCVYTGAVPSVDGTVFTRSVSKLSSDAGYAGATYDLYITSETCQATKDAVDATFTTVDLAIKNYWNLP